MCDYKRYENEACVPAKNTAFMLLVNRNGVTLYGYNGQTSHAAHYVFTDLEELVKHLAVNVWPSAVAPNSERS